MVSKIDSWEEHTNRATIQVRGPEAMSAVADIAQHEARDLYLDGVAAALRGKRATAEQLLRASLALDPQNHLAWLWLAGVVVKPEESLKHLEHVLELAPNNPHALEGIEWAKQKLSSQQGAVARDVVIPSSEQAGKSRPEDSSICEPTTPIQVKTLPFIWIALVALGVLLLLASAAICCINTGFLQSLLEHNLGIPPQPVQTSTIIAEVNTPAAPVTFTAIPAAAVTSRAAIRLTAVPTVTIEFKPPTKSPLTKQFIAIATSPAVILPSPTSQHGEPSAFRPGWYPAISPVAALRRSNWRSPIAPLEKDLKKTQSQIRHKGKWIDVDIGDQMLRAFEDDKLVMEFIVSTGPPNAPTVQGQFHIIRKYRAIDMSGPGYYVPAVPYAMFFHGGYAIHGAYWHNEFGRPNGHGCVNMKPEEAKKLFEWSDPALARKAHSAQATTKNKGTLVVIHE